METVNLNLFFFGPLKNYFGNKTLMMVPKGTKLGMVLKILRENEPKASEILGTCKIAVNSEFETADYIILQASEVAILPPFSGG